jgi:UPF0755 protein
MAKKTEKNNSGMKWKAVYGLFSLLAISATSLVGIVYYYNFDPHVLLSLSFYENLANPSVRIIRVQEGLRKEQIANLVGDKLDWSEDEKNQFVNLHLAINSDNLEGRYFPKTYMLLKDADPVGVTSAMLHEYSKETSTIKKPKSKTVVNEETALTIASIIQRESGGKSDMNLISGIIWNRLFKGMKLQIDATLQYAKGSEEDGWWTKVAPSDKKIDSPYNTYTNTGLPPSPIANPGLAAIEAAYNPVQTSCLFYLHDKYGKIHCSSTYEGHKNNIKKYIN